MDRFVSTVDGSIPVEALCLDNEELVTSQEGVGLYHGAQKVAERQSGSVYLTTHRLLYIDTIHPRKQSIALDLSLVKETNHYAGFFTSSPKVTLVLIAPRDEDPGEISTWRCSICGNNNRPNIDICGECGVPRQEEQPNPPLAPIPTPASSNACPACTFINDPAYRFCEMCNTPLTRLNSPTPPSKSIRSSPSPLVGQPDDERGNELKVSFRAGGDKAFYAALKRTLLAKAWSAGNRSGRSPVVDAASAQSGIHAIMKAVDVDAETTQAHIRSAVDDLGALMSKAKDMVQLASSLNQKVTAHEEHQAQLQALQRPMGSSGPEPEETAFVRSSMTRLGLPVAAVTSDMVKDESLWASELARELAGVLSGNRTGKGLMHNRGIIGLDEVWCGWNRSRGVALLPPSAMLLAVSHLPQYTDPPIRMRTFHSGLRALHFPQYTHAAFTSRLLSLISLSGPKTAVEIAAEERLSVGLIKEMIDGVERDGEIVRDKPSTNAELRWWANSIRGYTWDGGS